MGRAAATALLRFWDGLLAARAAALLSRAGLDGAHLGARPDHWSLAADLVRLAGWNHYLWLAGWRQPAGQDLPDPNSPEFRRAATEYFEQRAVDADRTLRGLLNQFSTWLGNLL